jgi:hypothetical protein
MPTACGPPSARTDATVPVERLPVERTADGRFALLLETRERRVLASLVDELRQATANGPDLADPAFARLYPDARPDDPVASAAFADLTRADLEQGRRQALETVAATLDASSLDGAEAAAWLGVCNDLRLVLATRLGITGDGQLEDPDQDDPDAWVVAVFHYLGWLVSAFVDALAAGLPEVPDAAGDPPA